MKYFARWDEFVQSKCHPFVMMIFDILAYNLQEVSITNSD